MLIEPASVSSVGYSPKPASMSSVRPLVYTTCSFMPVASSQSPTVYSVRFGRVLTLM